MQNWEAAWTIIQSTHLPKSVFLKNILEKKFPSCSFIYRKFSSADFHKKRKEFISGTCDGVISELKSIVGESLRLFDKIVREYRDVPHILVLTPMGYELLKKHRKKVLDRAMVILSETKSLDYLMQLPRFIEEVGVKHRLRAQNERLHKLIQKRLKKEAHFDGSLVKLTKCE